MDILDSELVQKIDENQLRLIMPHHHPEVIFILWSQLALSIPTLKNQSIYVLLCANEELVLIEEGFHDVCVELSRAFGWARL